LRGAIRNCSVAEEVGTTVGKGHFVLRTLSFVAIFPRSDHGTVNKVERALHKMRIALSLFSAPTLLRKQVLDMNLFVRLIGAKNPPQILTHFMQASLHINAVLLVLKLGEAPKSVDFSTGRVDFGNVDGLRRNGGLEGEESGMIIAILSQAAQWLPIFVFFLNPDSSLPFRRIHTFC
jgi:hypothetical protein